MSKYKDSVRLVIKCNRAAADSMLPLLKELRFMGNAGCSRGIKIEDYDGHNSAFGFDGDGPDRIESIELDGKLVKANADMLDYFVKKFQREGLYKKGTEKKFDPKEVAMGMQVEREHTDSKELIREIVLDHLMEDAHYYTKLGKWEKKMEKAKYTRRTGGPGNYKYFYGTSEGNREALSTDNTAAQAHIDKYYGKAFSVGGKRFAVGDRATWKGKPAQVVADYKNNVIIYDYTLGNVITVNPKQVKVDRVKKSIGEARMNLVIPLKKAEVKNDGQPKRDDYDNEFEFRKACMKWKAKNKTEKSVVYMPTEMLKGEHLGKVGSTQGHLNKVGSGILEHKGSVKGKGNAKGTTPPQKPTGGGTTNKPEGAPKAESSKKGGTPSRVKGLKPGDKPPYKNYKATASGSASSAASNYLKMTSVKDGKPRFLKLGSLHRAKFDHAGNCVRVTVDGKSYSVRNYLVKLPSGVYHIDGMVSVADKVVGAKK